MHVNCTVIKLNSLCKPILFLYCDGGPDHRLTYISVQLSIICLFLKLNLYYICVARIAPYNSWKKPCGESDVHSQSWPQMRWFSSKENGR